MTVAPPVPTLMPVAGPVLVKSRLHLSGFHLVKGSIGDSAQQLFGFVVTNLPGRSDLEECLTCGRAQPFLYLLVGQIRRQVLRKAGNRLGQCCPMAISCYGVL